MADKHKVILKEGQCCDCQFMEEMHQNQAPLGSGLVWFEQFEDCYFEDSKEANKLTKEDWDKWEDDWGFDEKNKCPYWKGLDIAVCEEHGEYIGRDGCLECGCERYEAEQKQRKEWGSDQYED